MEAPLATLAVTFPAPAKVAVSSLTVATPDEFVNCVPVEGVKEPKASLSNLNETTIPARGPVLESTTVALTSAGVATETLSLLEILRVTVTTPGVGVVPPSSEMLPPPPHAIKKNEHNPARKTLYADFIVRLPVTLMMILKLDAYYL